MVTGNGAAWIILPAVVNAVVIAVLAALWVSWQRERRRGYTPDLLLGVHDPDHDRWHGVPRSGWAFRLTRMKTLNDVTLGLPSLLASTMWLSATRRIGREGPGPVVAVLECWLVSASFSEVTAVGIMPSGGAGPRC